MLSVTSVLFLYFSTLTLSETPYALISILALRAIDRQTRLPQGKTSSEIVLGLLLALPFLTRVIGIVLVPFGLVTLYLSGRRVRWVLLGAGFVVLPWVLWMLAGTKWNQNQINTYHTNYARWWSSFGLLNLFRLFQYNSLNILINLPRISFGLLIQLIPQ
jgi:4-amino-4-deoxy-L-arabinose transferase-like glycosyltransferase